jgi:DNA-binding response OmpR family regulator
MPIFAIGHMCSTFAIEGEARHLEWTERRSEKGSMSEPKIVCFGSSALISDAIRHAVSNRPDIRAEFLSTADGVLLLPGLGDCVVVLVRSDVSDRSSSIDLCARVRLAKPSSYIIVFNSRGSWNEIVAALNAGADDCIDDSANVHEIAARIRAAVRPSSPPSRNSSPVGEAQQVSALHVPDRTAASPDNLEVRDDDVTESLRVAARRIVGSLGLTEAQRLVRKTMAKEALTRFDGNRHAVARTLQVDRRYVLKLIEEHPEIDPRSASRHAEFSGSERK